MKAKYTEEFKLEAVRLVLVDGKSQRQIASELGVNVNSLSRWIQLYGPSSNSPLRNEALARDVDAENARLKRENVRLRRERDILKKAVGILSNGEMGEL